MALDKKLKLSIEAAKALEEQRKKEAEAKKEPKKGSFLKRIFDKQEQK